MSEDIQRQRGKVYFKQGNVLTSRDETDEEYNARMSKMTTAIIVGSDNPVESFDVAQAEVQPLEQWEDDLSLDDI